MTVGLSPDIKLLALCDYHQTTIGEPSFKSDMELCANQPMFTAKHFDTISPDGRDAINN